MTIRTRRRLGTVVLAPSAALTAWALMRLGGVDFVVSTGNGTVGPLEVAVTALVGALAGWLVVRLLEHRVRNPLAWWSFVGSTGLAVSIMGPSWLADGASAVGLITLHVVTAVVVIAGFAGTLPASQRAAEIRRAQGRPGSDAAR